MEYVTSTSFWGVGTTLYGWRPASIGGHIVTRWVTFLFFPIVPLRSFVIDFTKDGRGVSDSVLSMFGVIRDSLRGVARPSMCWRQVVNTYLYVYLPWAIGLYFGPVVPPTVSLLLAAMILASWLYAAIMMRRAFRRRSSNAT